MPTNTLPETRLRETLSRYRREASNRVYMIDLAVIRERLGERWPAVVEKVTGIAQQSIERHLTVADMSAPYGDGLFLVVFSHLGQREAELKCLLIAREIGRRLVGSDEASDVVKVRTVDIQENGDISYTDANLDASAEALQREVGQSAIRSLSALPKLMTASLPHWDHVQFIYRPLLSLRGMVVSTFICVPIRALGGQKYASGHSVLPNPADEYQVADLDMVVLAKIIADLQVTDERDVRALLCLPVHFQTLSNPRFREVYLGLCRQYLPTLTQRLIFELVDLPEGVVQSRLHDMVATLRPHCRAVIARVPLGQKVFSSFRLAGLHAVGTDIYYAKENEEFLMHAMEHFIDKAEREGLKTYIHGLRSVSLATSAISSGFDYIDGYSLTSVVNIPNRPLRYELRQLYAALSGLDKKS